VGEAPIRRESDSKKKKEKKIAILQSLSRLTDTDQAGHDSIAPGVVKSAKYLTADEFVEQGLNLIQPHTAKVHRFLFAACAVPISLENAHESE
jgi:hypothetical protein